ncbi:MAG: glycosyltransferase family 4 protein [Verrucomicrobia bacterium]|nr:glycosyltransferase family 4 protein [Verrucomicrobiota bacterium]
MEREASKERKVGRRPLRILHLVGATEDTGGILTVIRNLQEATRAAGCAHVVLNHASYRERRKPSLDCRFSRHFLDESPSHWELFLGAARALPELRRLLRSEPFHVLHGHSRGALVLAALARRLLHPAVLFTNHTYGCRRGMYRWAARRGGMVTALLTPNMARYYGIDPHSGRVEFVPDSCDDRYFEIPLVARRDWAASPPVRLIGLSSVVRWKKWDLLLKAFARLEPQVRSRLRFDHWGLVLQTGSSRAYRRELEETLRREGLEGQCRFHGMSLAVEEELRKADVFVLPSTNEPCSVALGEALALGMPAVVSRSGGNVDIVQDGKTGLLFTPDDPDDLARALRRIALGEITFVPQEAIRESVRFRKASEVARRYLAIYERLKAGRSGEERQRN